MSQSAAGLSLERYLRALWGEPFQVSFAEASVARVVFDGREQMLPHLTRSGATDAEFTLARARSAHAAAHAVFSGPRFATGALKPLQQVLVSLFEDARVEALALQRFPGLRRLWAPFHTTAAPTPRAPFGTLMARLSRALFDASYVDPDAWIQKARHAFAAVALSSSSPEHSRALGNLLGNDLGQMRLPFDARQYQVEPAYRDDHSGLWEQPPMPAKSVSRTASTSSDAEAPQPRAAVTHAYPEWDYAIARERPAFCELSDEPALSSVGQGQAAALPLALVQQARRGLRRALSAPSHERRVSDGPLLDLNAAVDAAAERRAERTSQLLVYRRPKRRARRASALLLLDLSESSNLPLPNGSAARQLSAACARLLCEAAVPALELAIDGFSSYGRKDVRYSRFKDFAEPGALAAARLAELGAAGSTRLGAAVRHASARLQARPAQDKLLLIISDGDPADIDIHDADYFVEDARHAVRAARRAGIAVFACCLPGGPAHIQRRIFGRQHAPLEQLGDLPTRLHVAFAARGGRPS